MAARRKEGAEPERRLTMFNLMTDKEWEKVPVDVVEVLEYLLEHGWARLVHEVPEYFLEHGWARRVGNGISIELTTTGKLHLAKILGMVLAYFQEHGWAELVNGSSLELTDAGKSELTRIPGIGMA